MAPTTTATALSAVSVIPFHCIICFEEFDLRDRTPVVLPCGHTFVCGPCSARLRRCMECREPLTLNPPSATTVGTQPLSTRTNHVTTSRNQRYGPAEAPKRSNDQIPLPIPRNLLMISLLEAAERQEKLFGEALFVDESMETSMISAEAEIMNSPSQEEDEEMENILIGIETMVGPCGTYLVKDPEGLDVLPFDPRRHKRQDDTASPPPLQEPFTIDHRQTVQVVGVSDGVFELARSTGYIVANEHQLVKVGTPLEKSCQLEGMKHLVDLRKQDLQQQVNELQGKLDRIMRLSDGLQIRRDEVLAMDPDHPVIAEAPEPEDCDKSSAQGSNPIVTPDSCDSPMVLRSPGREVIVSATSSHEVEVTESPVVNHYSLQTPNTIDNSELDREFVDETRRSIANALLPLDLGCGSGLFGPTHVETSGSFDSVIDTPAVRPRLTPPAIAPLPASMSPPSIDFSTGLSGHRGIAKTRSGTHAIPTRQVRMMGAHRGLGSTRSRRLPPQNSNVSSFPLSGMFARSPQGGPGGQYQQAER